MPKDEFDFEDPMELSGVMLASDEDTSTVMCECFIEEYMRLGYNHKQIFALFRNPYYLGMNMVLQQRGEEFIRERISEVFALWGKPILWNLRTAALAEAEQSLEAGPPENAEDQQENSELDPMGYPVPKLNL